MKKKEYKSLTIPRLMWEKKVLTESYGKIVAQPLEPGFGLTLGNALRRVLLGSVEGCAVTSVIIKGVNNEFASLVGVEEDVMQLLLNIKEIVVRNTLGKAGTMRLSVHGEKVARVSDIVADSHLELINKDHVIGRVSQGGELTIEFTVDMGRGYQPALWPLDKVYQEDGRIYLDSMFSPVICVTFDVEKTRVGQDIDYDKLTITITTDGSENPIDVLHYAVSVLRTQLEHFLLNSEIPFNEISGSPEEIGVKKQPHVLHDTLKGVPLELLLKTIEQLELPVRAYNCLAGIGIKRVIDLVNKSEDDILQIKNFGRKSLNEVKEKMKEDGLSFNMGIREEDVKRALDIQE